MASRSDPERQRQWVLAAVDCYESPLVRFARRLLGDEDSARDVVQHAFLRLCDQSPEALGDRVGGWLFAVCRNRAMDLLRGRKKAGPLGEVDLPGRQDDPAIAAERTDLCRCLMAVMDRLPAGQKDAILLWSQGLGYREIAEALDTSEGNVRVLMHRGLKALRQHPSVRQFLEPGTCVPQAAPATEQMQ